MTKPGIQLSTLLIWSSLGLAAWALIIMLVSCGLTDRVDRALVVAEKSVALVEETKAHAAEISRQADEGDWLGLTEAVLIGLGGVAGTLGVGAGVKKLKETGNGTKDNNPAS